VQVRDAAVRAVRSFIQGTVVAGGVFLGDVATSGRFAGFSEHAPVFFFAEALAAGYALVSFLQNFLETNTTAGDVIPRG